MTIAFKPLFQSTDAGIPPVSQTVTNLKVANKTFNQTVYNSGNTTVYTVPAGRIFFMTFYSYYFFNSAGALRQATVTAGQLTLRYYYSPSASPPEFEDVVFSTPIPIFAGETIIINHSGTLCTSILTLAGFETDA